MTQKIDNIMTYNITKEKKCDNSRAIVCLDPLMCI